MMETIKEGTKLRPGQFEWQVKFNDLPHNLRKAPEWREVYQGERYIGSAFVAYADWYNPMSEIKDEPESTVLLSWEAGAAPDEWDVIDYWD